MEKIYPRPRMVRRNWESLDGIWTMCGKPIRVPYPPQSRLSGWEGEIPKKMVYERRFAAALPEGGQRVLLHFGAVDQTCEVFLNGQKVGGHEGGYLPFFFDITEYLTEGDNILRVEAVDTLSRDYPYGKQTETPGGMWYTQVSGIWQTVWYETVPEEYIEDVIFTADIHTGTVSWRILTSKGGSDAEVLISAQGGRIAEVSSSNEGRAVLPKEEIRFWSPDDPFLYRVTVRIPSGDEVDTYFAMREFAIENRGGVNRLCLNGEPLFLHGVLDQGYFPDGIFLPEDMRNYDRDICLMKQMGFNTLRKHIKIEPQYFYSACDRLGMIVVQDMVNSGDYSFLRDTALPTIGFKRRNDRRTEGKREAFFIKHMTDTADHLKGHPCIAAYTIFNEGWGQFNSSRVYDILKERCGSALIDTASGWFTADKSDFDSEHVYFREKRLKPGRRPMLLSECGGFIFRASKTAADGPAWGYGKCRSSEEYTEKIEHMYRHMVIPAIRKGLCGSVFTQLSDVENELNGLVTYDRKMIKADVGRMRNISQMIAEETRTIQTERREEHT